MKVRVPGKLVISGAYVVLDGAPAVVAAVDRYAVADDRRRATSLSNELRAAFPRGDAPWVDTTALQFRGRKMGLGSSAAVTVAALATRWGQQGSLEHGQLAQLAYKAHRQAQGGGSGVDIIACTFGGIRACVRERHGVLPTHDALSLPAGIVVEAWFCPTSAATADLLGKVQAFRAADPAGYARLLDPAVTGAHQFVDALRRNAGDAALTALDAQRRAMVTLGEATHAPILPFYMAELAAVAMTSGGVFYQAGAGGGDMALFVGPQPSPGVFRELALRLGLQAVDLRLGAAGTHLLL